MTTQKNKELPSTWTEKIENGNLFFNREYGQNIRSLKAISQVIFAFSLLFIGAYLFKLFSIGNEGVTHFKLVLTPLNILPLYHANFWGFVFITAYEVIKLMVISGAFYFFSKFLGSLDKTDPFKNSVSNKYIQWVSVLGVLFFCIDAVGTLHLSLFENIVSPDAPIRIFHFEYLFLAYFIHVFAFVFKRGVELKEEIDLVI